MGTWGNNILDDDLARDIYDNYLDLFDTDISSVEALKQLEKTFASSLKCPDEAHLFWLAIAQAQWDCGCLDKEVKTSVERIITGGEGLELWKEAGKSVLEKRQVVLAKFLAKLEHPNPKPRRKKTRPKAVSPFALGDCLSIQLVNNKFAAAIITRCESTPSTSYQIFSILDYYADSPPPAGAFLKPHWLPVVRPETKGNNLAQTENLSPENLLIVKACVYPEGYTRNKKYYSIVCNNLPSFVPQPLTLLPANFNSLRRHLEEQFEIANND